MVPLLLPCAIVYPRGAGRRHGDHRLAHPRGAADRRGDDGRVRARDDGAAPRVAQPGPRDRLPAGLANAGDHQRHADREGGQGATL